MNQIPDGLERELAPRDGRWCRMQARRDDRNPQHGAATIIDIGVSVSMPQATHRNQRKAPSVEWMGRIRDRDLFGPSILRPNRGIKKWDRRRHRCPRSRYPAGRRSRAAGASRSTSAAGTSPCRARRRPVRGRPQPRGAEIPASRADPPSAPGPRRSRECVPAATPRLSRDRPGRIAGGPTLVPPDLLGRRLPNVDDRQAITMLGADPVAECSGQRDHGRPPSIRSVGGWQDSVGSAGRGGSSPCAAATPAVATTSFGPAKGSRSRRRSSQWTTFSKAAWPALGYGINRLND